MYKNLLLWVIVLKWLVNGQTNGKLALSLIYPNKPQKSFLAGKLKTIIIFFIVINKNYVSQASAQNHLSIVLDTRLNFQGHNKGVVKKNNKIRSLFHKLRNIIPRETLITIYKTFVRHHLHYGDTFIIKLIPVIKAHINSIKCLNCLN